MTRSIGGIFSFVTQCAGQVNIGFVRGFVVSGARGVRLLRQTQYVGRKRALLPYCAPVTGSSYLFVCEIEVPLDAADRFAHLLKISV